MDAERLIALVQEETAIWDCKNEKHANLDFVHKSWIKIAAELGCEGKFYIFMTLYTFYESYKYISRLLHTRYVYRNLHYTNKKLSMHCCNHFNQNYI